MIGCLRALVRAPRFLILSVALTGAALFAVSGLPSSIPAADAASPKYLMCNWTVEKRTQTVYIDPSLSAVGVSKAQVLGAFEPWNRLFTKYHGFPIFIEHHGPASTADVVIDAHSFKSTWVDGKCNPGYKTAGRSHTTLYLGSKDKWRNAGMLAHELGHALGLADHGTNAQHAAGHIGFKPCSNYYGVMSYCTSSQSWFLDFEQRGLYLDGQLVRDYF